MGQIEMALGGEVTAQGVDAGNVGTLPPYVSHQLWGEITF